jgi:hypothetical protein
MHARCRLLYFSVAGKAMHSNALLTSTRMHVINGEVLCLPVSLSSLPENISMNARRRLLSYSVAAIDDGRPQRRSAEHARH